MAQDPARARRGSVAGLLWRPYWRSFESAFPDLFCSLASLVIAVFNACIVCHGIAGGFGPTNTINESSGSDGIAGDDCQSQINSS
jgi:hypothetical protein